jgi:hypothetical protein
MPTARPGQREKRSKGEGHAERSEPIAAVHPVPIKKGDDRKDDEQLGRDYWLHKAQTADPEGCHLEGETEDHAGDSEKPDGAMKQVVDELEPRGILPRCRRGGTVLGDRGERSKHTRREGECDHLGLHVRTPADRLRHMTR